MNLRFLSPRQPSRRPLFGLALLGLLLIGGCGSGDSGKQTDKSDPASGTQAEEQSGSSDAASGSSEAGALSGSEIPAVSAEECGPKMARFIELMNRYADLINKHGLGEGKEPPEMQKVQKQLDQVGDEISQKGRSFYVENHSKECWKKYSLATQRLSHAAMQEASKQMEKGLQEAQKELQQSQQEMQQQ